MNKNSLDFIEYLLFFLKEGYSLQDIINLCEMFDLKKEANEFSMYLTDGNSIDEAILLMNLPKLFKEYFAFFKNNFSIDNALEKSLDVCKKRNEIKDSLLKKLAYPIMLLVFIFVFSIFVVLYLLPEVEMLFIDFNIKKNFFISLLFSLLHILPVFLILTSILLVVIVIYVKFSISNQQFHRIDFLLKYTKFIKNIICKYYSLKFAIYYNELLLNNYDTTTIIEILYEKIGDSDIKMIVYELYNLILEGKGLDMAIYDFPYFSKDFKMFILLLNNMHEEKSLNEYIKLSLIQIDRSISRFIKTIVPLIYIFVAGFVIIIYISIIIPMMNVISTL